VLPEETLIRLRARSGGKLVRSFRQIAQDVAQENQGLGRGAHNAPAPYLADDQTTIGMTNQHDRGFYARQGVGNARRIPFDAPEGIGRGHNMVAILFKDLTAPFQLDESAADETMREY
jgi:hypothetical protein